MNKTDKEIKFDHRSKKISRRDFCRNISKGVVSGAILTGLISPKSSWSYASGDTSKVVRIHHSGATDGSGGKDNENIVESAVKLMVDKGVMTLTGKTSVADAWSEIIPDITKKVAIKVNCQITGIYTKYTVVKGILNGLIERGVHEDNIIIYDRTDNAFDFAGFIKNTGPGIKVGTVNELGGWSSSPGLYEMAKLMCSESGMYDCDYLINVPCHKALDGYAGVTLSMKNHYGTCTPEHDDIMNRIPLYNALPQIRDKTRLIVLDAIFSQYKWFNGRSQGNIDITNELLFSTDPVAIDHVGWQMLEALRSFHGLPAVSPAPDYIHHAAINHELGTDDPDEIELIDIAGEGDGSDATDGAGTGDELGAGTGGGGCFLISDS